MAPRLPATRLDLIGLLALAVSACTAAKESDPALVYTCQFKPCVCVPAQATLFNRAATVPLKWKQNGDAYCPEGHALRLDTKKK